MSEPKGMPAQWALDEAARRSGWRDWDSARKCVTATPYIFAHARTIEKNEQPPVDPDILAVRDILAVWYGADTGMGKGSLSGEWDSNLGFQAAVATYKRAKNGGAK